MKTSGSELGIDVITQFGYCRVIAGQVQSPVSFFLNWPAQLSEAEAARIQNRMRQVDVSFSQKGETTSATWEALSTGVPPGEGMQRIIDILLDASDRLIPVLAHNGVRFDMPFIDFEAKRLLGIDFSPFVEDMVVDTGSLLLAAKLGTWLHAGESLEAFSDRVNAYMVAGVRWSLRSFAEEVGVEFFTKRDAAMDARVCAACVQSLQRLAR